jgi:endonuclease/exonuclease/phosphatase family metal-dependent hydrolase
MLYIGKRLLQFGLLLLMLPLVVRAQDQQIHPVEFRMMTFNIWVGGEIEDFGNVIKAVQAAGADIVGLQEAGGNTRRIADALGWPYASERMQIISRYPLIDPPDGDGLYIYAQINPGQVVALANVHLPSDPYGPYDVRDGKPLSDVLELERTTRLPKIEEVLAKVRPLMDAGVPVLLTGDFNTPSGRDWTATAIANRPLAKYAVQWPVPQAVEEAGFQDTYRLVHPDPVKQPGITWTYGYPYPRLKDNEMIDRIDFVFASKGITVLDSRIAGPTGSPDADIEVQPWPSDHRAVVSTVRLTPVVPPLFVAPEHRVVQQGESLVVRYHAPNGEDTDRIVITPTKASAKDGALMSLPPYEASFFGSVTFGTAGLKPGVYDAVLVGADGKEESRNTFWVTAPNTPPSIHTAEVTYKAGDAIKVVWENGPANRWDWIAIYPANEPDYFKYLGYLYTNSQPSGEVVFDAAALGEAMLPPGDYVVKLMLDDVYIELAESSFSVAAKN